MTVPIGQPQLRPGATIYVSFSAEINAHTTESLIAAMANCANARPAQVVLLLSTPGWVVMNGMNLYWILRPVRASVPLWREPPFRGGVSHLDAVG